MTTDAKRASASLPGWVGRFAAGRAAAVEALRGSGGRPRRLDAALDVVDAVGALPGEVLELTAEVPVRRGLLVDRAPKVEVAQDRGRTEVEDFLDALLYLLNRHRLRPE